MAVGGVAGKCASLMSLVCVAGPTIPGLLLFCRMVQAARSVALPSPRHPLLQSLMMMMLPRHVSLGSDRPELLGQVLHWWNPFSRLREWPIE